MKLKFNYYMPTRIIFGAGELNTLSTTPYLLGKKALVVISSGDSMKKYGYLDRVRRYLKESGVQTVLFDKILPNPIVEHVAVYEGKNLEARSAVAWASTESGIVESLSSCVSHHSMQHALNAFHPELPHGAGLIALSVAYFSFMAEKCPERFVDLAKAMGENIDLLSEKERTFAFISALKKLIKNIGMEDLKLSNFGIRKEEAEILAKNSMDTMGSLFKYSDPYKLSLEEIISIYKACL